jgi:ribosomal protein L19E
MLFIFIVHLFYIIHIIHIDNIVHIVDIDNIVHIVDIDNIVHIVDDVVVVIVAVIVVDHIVVVRTKPQTLQSSLNRHPVRRNGMEHARASTEKPWLNRVLNTMGHGLQK